MSSASGWRRVRPGWEDEAPSDDLFRLGVLERVRFIGFVKFLAELREREGEVEVEVELEDDE